LRLEEEFERVLPKYRKACRSVILHEEFKGLGIPEVEANVSPVAHLRKVPLCQLFQKWIAADPGRRKFGYLPFMATHSRASVGSLLASS
jgi:hypothetical protein